MIIIRKTLFWVIITFLVFSCGQDKPGFKFQEQGREVPQFSADSANYFIERQVNFGPRVPNTQAHKSAKNFIKEKLQKYAGQSNVFVQNFENVVYGDTLQLYNIIAAFGTQYSDRIVLAAHWDSRPMAEKDPIDPDSPILGADDGGSGVGVLLELARIFRDNPPVLGVDLIFFDGEDYGKPSDLEFYFLGSRHWGNNPPVPGYNPRFGILLDMVGGKNAVFPKEGYSMQYAPSLVNEIWKIAAEKGHSDLFLDQRGAPISDDHVIVQRLTGIPMINIIHHRVGGNGEVIFPEYWHTHRDNMDIISTHTLQAVGDILLELIYNRIPV
ncbi:MAG: M28 family peptidase [Balneolaceae bacterium]